jgi:hypothetical protein
MHCGVLVGDILSIITPVGALVGLLTGIFTFWDRYARGRPIAFLNVEVDGDEFTPKLVVSNPGDYAIFLLNVRVLPKIYFLNRGKQIRTLLDDVVSGNSYLPI